MQVSEGRIGRIFILRLEDDEVIPTCIEQLAQQKGIKFGWVTVIGCLEKGDVAMGPKDGGERPPQPMMIPMDGVHEMLAAGLIAPNSEGRPILHIHGAMGRAGHTLAGCLREGSSVWCYAEAVIYEINGTSGERILDQESGFVMLDLNQNDNNHAK
ncbi:PPC domain-containing DNA-binding protein [Candidatus Formimonas warabiya]|uniref:PPC domain-containing protein n=1 Tax=Formimonas warabiya TaxID=1761012 RepID=A0A3G1KTF4_FORW1|nr:DUF296 domain-containing protein [Candidatus Formimonas warabiya]ATW25710.1 hypothetical protein DCMF_13895 [Candidatus Formimonas warabiya]